MAEKDPQKEEHQRAAESEQRDEGDAPERKKERLKDLDVTKTEGGALKGGIPKQPDIM